MSQTKEVLHGMDPREPFLGSGPEDVHDHECPDCHRTYQCRETLNSPFGDSDEDCRWYKTVVCPECLRKRNLVNG